MNIRNKRFLTLGLTTALSSAFVAGVVLSIIHVKNKNNSAITKKTKGSVFLASENGNKKLDVIQEHQDLAFQSIENITNQDFHTLYSNDDKLKLSTHEQNNKTHEIIQLIKSKIKGKYHFEAKRLIDHNIVSLKPSNGLMQIELMLHQLKRGSLKRTIDVTGFKTNEQKAREDIASVKRHLESVKGLKIEIEKAIAPMNKELIFNANNWKKLKLQGMSPFDYKGTQVFFKHSGIDKDGILSLKNRIVKNNQDDQTTLNVAVTGIDAAKKAKEIQAAQAAKEASKAQEKLKQLNKDVALVANQFLKMGMSFKDGVSTTSLLANAKSIKPNSFQKYENKETPNAPSVFGFKAPLDVPDKIVIKYVPHTFLDISGEIVVSVNIIHSGITIRTIDLIIKGFKGLF